MFNVPTPSFEIGEAATTRFTSQILGRVR